ncbi:branched-chain amino acid transaminase [Salisaeta longa]|uniref:branched-chain amino acid transaminase n=1 Tax=Salisaeta longa TaxID=503170 RepID=UPI0003B35C5E|nr:branched-chain amino acid transaminase [Salisaeta longa]
MTPDIWYNGEFIPHEDAQVHVLSHVVHYGSSVFEGIRCYNTDQGSAIFRLEPHMRRLVDSAKIHRMNADFTQAQLEQAVMDTVERSGLAECYIRPVIFRGMGPMGVNPLENDVDVFVAVWEWGKYLGEEALQQGVDVEVASWNRLAPNTLPSMAKAGGNYLNASLVKMNAVKNGMTEGIMLNTNGYLAEGSGENLFVVRDETLYTAPVGLSILPGITRDAVITLAQEMGYTVEEKSLPREALYIADEVFFTGTAAEITPIRSVDHYTVGEGRRGPVTKALQDAFFDIVEGGNDPYDWLTFVDIPTEAAEPATP